jgi:hypothetical protein
MLLGRVQDHGIRGFIRHMPPSDFRFRIIPPIAWSAATFWISSRTWISGVFSRTHAACSRCAGLRVCRQAAGAGFADTGLAGAMVCATASALARVRRSSGGARQCAGAKAHTVRKFPERSERPEKGKSNTIGQVGRRSFDLFSNKYPGKADLERSAHRKADLSFLGLCDLCGEFLAHQFRSPLSELQLLIK